MKIIYQNNKTGGIDEKYIEETREKQSQNKEYQKSEQSDGSKEKLLSKLIINERMCYVSYDKIGGREFYYNLSGKDKLQSETINKKIIR